MRDLTIPNDATVMKLAHPIRLSAGAPNLLQWFEQMLGPEWPLLEKYLKDETLVLAEVGYRLTAQHHVPRFWKLVQLVSGAEGNTEQGGAFTLLSWLRYNMIRFTHFRFADSLVELLEHTDLDADVPVSYLVPPFPFSYIELGESREVQTCIHNESSGLHRLEGAYVERAAHHEHPDCLYITLTGSPVGHENAMDDSTLSVLLPLDDLEAPLAEVLLRVFSEERDSARAMGLQLSSQRSVEYGLEALKLVAKALLYLGLPEARRTVHAERAALEKAGSQLKSTAKKAKMARKLARAYDYVLVEAPTAPPREPSHAGSERSPKAHWRRGHYRMQAHGPQNSLRKMVFIRPTLVAGTVVDRPATYHVH